jgi:GNAT superfamily N-acetyltransferase
MRKVLRAVLPLEGLDVLLAEAAAEGFAFLEPLVADWESGENRFSGPGEGFYAVFAGDQLVAIGGLNQDPFLRSPEVGRLRRIYVRAAWRRQGIGEELVKAMLADARQSFSWVRLRAENAGAARLYERLGFTPCADEHATHTLHLGT